MATLTSKGHDGLVWTSTSNKFSGLKVCGLPVTTTRDEGCKE